MMKLRTLIAAGDPEKVAGGFEFLEGPLWHPEGFLIFSDIPAAKIYRCTADGQVAVWRDSSGNSNGLTFDPEGRLVACEHGNRRVSRTLADGKVVALAEQYNGKRLNRPNDVVAKSDGSIYFSDPPYGKNPGERMDPAEIEQPCNGVYRVRPDGVLELVASDFERPNGLAFSPDESILYIDDSARRHVRALDVQPDGSLANSRIVADLDHPQPGSPDGMKIDAQGNLYVAGATGVWVFTPEGEHLGVVVTPERPANLAWGDADRQTLYVTARTTLYRFRTLVPGATPVWV
jgi:gluconolactonase